MTDLRGDSMTGEQFVFEERAADPASSVEGERWLRTDLNSGDKLATLRVDVGGSTLDVPVFPTGTSEDGVTEALRVRVGAQTGYIPAIADTSTAGFPQLRLQHDGQVYGYHNEQGVFAFFDVAISSTNSPVDEGSDLNVDYSVQNTGFSANNTQDIRLNIDSTEEDRDTNITLSPSSSTTGTLTWTTPSSSAGTYNASVLSDDDTASTSVTVEEFAIPDSVLTQDLVAWYRFEEGDARDYTAILDAQFADSTAYDGTVQGAAFQPSGGVTDFENGANSGGFDFSNDLIEYNTGNNFTAFNTDLSICIWHKANSLDDFGCIMAKVTNTGLDDADLGFWTNGGNVEYGANSDAVGTSQPVSTGVWHHYALTSNASANEARMYFDGNLISTSAANTKDNSTNDALNGFYTGTFNNVFDFALDGAVDDARIYDKTLTATEVSDIYNATEP